MMRVQRTLFAAHNLQAAKCMPDTALPERVRKLPRHAQDIYRAAFSDAFERYGPEREAVAHRIAWSTVKRHYVVGESGEWEPRPPRA